jgi:hypothetical protein
VLLNRSVYVLEFRFFKIFYCLISIQTPAGPGFGASGASGRMGGDRPIPQRGNASYGMFNIFNYQMFSLTI